jgi:alpha-1,6-mannosyltransferase
MTLFKKFAALGVAVVAGYAAIAWVGDQRIHPIQFQIIFWAVFAMYLCGIIAAWRSDGTEARALGTIMFFAVAIRLIMVIGPPTLSDDIYRYAWDGRVQAAGFNPYLVAPIDPKLAALQGSELYKILCVRYTPNAAVYPPLAEELFFVSAVTGSGQVYFIKIFLALLDIGSIWLLILILRRLKINPLRCIVYAWSPLAVIEISQSGHIEGLSVFLVLAATLAVLNRKDMAGGALAALAVAAKFTPAIFLPALYRRKDWRFPAAFALTLGVICLPYITAVKTFFGLSTQGANLPHFNAGLKAIGESVFGQSAAFSHQYNLFAIAVLAIFGMVVWLRNDGSDARTMDGLLQMAAVFLIVTPFLPSWYVLLIVPLMAWRLSPAYIWLSGASMLLYLVYLNPAKGTGAMTFIEYFVFFVLLLAQAAYHYWRQKQGLTPGPTVDRIIKDL